MPEPGHDRRELAATAAVDAVPDEVKKEVVLRALLLLSVLTHPRRIHLRQSERRGYSPIVSHRRPTFRELRHGEVRRIPLLRTRVNKGRRRSAKLPKEGRPSAHATHVVSGKKPWG